ncbi:MBL fold metallo-hydrolase [Pistricoccus aurantiacus]|uniref:MBL fold metallo-hydrolase n=1 Tax=Pistricoccus aurantiacus TaxID=1883414 RepID=A0A5B8SPH3_9GAMM|nr:MBL fold metallo-hydrolase [Pistricoccus aurantiacus]
MRLIPLIGALAALTFTATATAQQIDSVEVRDPIHMLTGKGGNIGVLIGEDGTFMIDDKFAPLTEAILAEVEQLGGSAPTFLINTHFHGDHTGGNENLGDAGSTIVAHEKYVNDSRKAAKSRRSIWSCRPKAVPLYRSSPSARTFVFISTARPSMSSMFPPPIRIATVSCIFAMPTSFILAIRCSTASFRSSTRLTAARWKG